MIIVKKRLSSIRWKIVFIYFLLVFIATTIIGVFIMSQLEAYYKDSIRDDIRKLWRKERCCPSSSLLMS